MHCAAVWQHSSKSSIKIVHNSIEHFLYSPPDLFFDDALSCLWIVFTKSVIQVPPYKIVRRVKILGTGWPGIIGLTQNESVPWKVMPELFKCTIREMRWRLISRTEQNTWIPQAKLPMGQTHFTSNRYPWPSYSQDLNQLDYFLRGYLKHRVCENKSQTREDIIRREIRLIPQEMHNKIVNNFNVRAASVLSYSSTVDRTNIALITEKVWRNIIDSRMISTKRIL